MMRTTRSGCLAIVLLASIASPAGAVILYKAGVGFRQPEINDLKGDALTPQKIDFGDFTFNGAFCPAPGTPNFLCANVLSEAGIDGGRLFLRSRARIKRTNAAATSPETAAYADSRISIYEVGGYAGTAPKAAFYFGMHGTLAKTGGAPGVTLQAFSRATLQAGSTTSNQCFGLETGCVPTVEPYRVVVEDWNPTTGFILTLRSDVFAGGAVDGWDAEVVADFADTLEVLAIQVLDENEVPIPGVQLTVQDGEGNTVTFPNQPVPEPGQGLLAATGALVLACAKRWPRTARPQ